MSAPSRRGGDALGVWALALAIGPLGCRGPRPEITGRTTHVDAQGLAWVTVQVRNRGGGQGAVDVCAALRDRTGRLVGQGAESVSLDPHQDLAVTLSVPLDPSRDTGSDRGLSTSVEVVYPPD